MMVCVVRRIEEGERGLKVKIRRCIGSEKIERIWVAGFLLVRDETIDDLISNGDMTFDVRSADTGEV